MKTDWEQFDPYIYIKDNYSSIHDEDREIIRRLVSFYSSLSLSHLALEIGIGPNLYPVMAMLPFVEKVEGIDLSTSNLKYLNKQLEEPDESWYKFWELFKSLSRKYDTDLVKSLNRKVTIKQGSVYSLEEDKYDLASMFFCAESITTEYDQFVSACNKFIKSVRAGGHLVAAFMENSQKYEIGTIEFPSYPVDTKLIREIFAPQTNDLLVTRIPLAREPLRSGYTGMVFLTATV